MLELKSISKSFFAAQERRVVLKDVSFQIKEGEYLFLLGSNGSGKSTLLNIISGSLSPDSGDIFLNSTSIKSKEEYLRAKDIARVFQNPLLGTSAELSVLENFRIAFCRNKSKQLKIGTGLSFKKMVEEKINAEFLDQKPSIYQSMGTLSGGQRQALTLLMATLSKSKLLLMDEPTAALDPKTGKNIMKLSKRLSSEIGLTTICISHKLSDALEFGDRILFLNNGKIEQDYINDDNINETELRKLYFPS